MSSEHQFKPLWAIHNKTYREYARNFARRRISRYMKKIEKILRNKIQKEAK